jgi:hypothetical protein
MQETRELAEEPKWKNRSGDRRRLEDNIKIGVKILNILSHICTTDLDYITMETKSAITRRTIASC